MAQEKTNKNFTPKRQISTEAITYAYTYRQITMSQNYETSGSGLKDECSPASTSQKCDVTVEEVLMWEAT